MKQPTLFKRLLDDWMMMPKLIEAGIEQGYVAREPKHTSWVPLKGLFAICDILAPEAYAEPGWAQVHNKFVMKFRRRAACSAFWSGGSQAELQARLQTYELLLTADFGSKRKVPCLRRNSQHRQHRRPSGGLRRKLVSDVEAAG